MRLPKTVHARAWRGVTPRVEPPPTPGYMLCAYERAELLMLSICGAVLVPLWVYVFVAFVGALGGRAHYAARVTPGTLIFGGLIALILVPVLHELLHGLAARLAGARPAFGIGPGYAFTTFEQVLRRWPYLAVGLAPLLIGSSIAVACGALWSGAAGWLIFAAVVNAAGSIGDLWMVWRVLRLPRQALFCDLADGFAALVPED